MRHDAPRQRAYTERVDAEAVIAELKDFFTTRGENVAAVYLFGSTARAEAGPGSDVDVAVLFAHTPPATLEGQPFDLSDAIEQRLGRPVDVVVLNTAPVDLRIRVLRDGRLVVERDAAARIRFEVATRNEWFDFAPILEEYRRPRRSA